MISPHPSATPLRPGAADSRRFLLLDFIGEHIGLAALQCQLVQLYVESGDQAGLAYALKKFAMYGEVAVRAFNDLANLDKEHREGGR